MYGTSVYKRLPLFRDRYRKKIGLPCISVSFKDASGKPFYGFVVTAGYDEFKGVYLKQSTLYIPYWGQDEVELVNIVKARLST